MTDDHSFLKPFSDQVFGVTGQHSAGSKSRSQNSGIRTVPKSMNGFHRHKTALLLGILLGGCDRQPEPPKPVVVEQPKPVEARPTPSVVLPQKILSVEFVEVKPVEGEPGKLTIAVLGSVNSGGWGQPELRLRTPQPEDGILTLVFFAQPPNDLQMPALKTLKLQVTVNKPAGYREVRVVARTNSMTAK